MCNGQLQKILAKALDNSRKCHQIFLHLYPHSQAVWAWLGNNTIPVLILTKSIYALGIPRSQNMVVDLTSMGISHPSHLQ